MLSCWLAVRKLPNKSTQAPSPRLRVPQNLLVRKIRLDLFAARPLSLLKTVNRRMIEDFCGTTSIPHDRESVGSCFHCSRSVFAVTLELEPIALRHQVIRSQTKPTAGCGCGSTEWCCNSAIPWYSSNPRRDRMESQGLPHPLAMTSLKRRAHGTRLLKSRFRDRLGQRPPRRSADFGFKSC